MLRKAFLMPPLVAGAKGRRRQGFALPASAGNQVQR